MRRPSTKTAKQRYIRDNKHLCPTCGGTGITTNSAASDRSKKAGNTTYLRSLQEGQLTMAERGKRGGAPRMWTIEDIRKGIAPRGSKENGALPNKGKGA